MTAGCEWVASSTQIRICRMCGLAVLCWVIGLLGQEL